MYLKNLPTRISKLNLKERIALSLFLIAVTVFSYLFIFNLFPLLRFNYQISSILQSSLKPVTPTPSSTVTYTPTPTPTPIDYASLPTIEIKPEVSTEGWETYTYNSNPEYAYSIKYPPTWKVSTDNPDSLVYLGTLGVRSEMVKSFLFGSINLSERKGISFAYSLNNSISQLENPMVYKTVLSGKYKSVLVRGIDPNKSQRDGFPTGINIERIFILLPAGHLYFGMSVDQNDTDSLKIFRTMLTTLRFPIAEK